MKDLTIIFLTVNKVPAEWADYHRKVLEEAIEDSPIITISKEPLDLGTNLIQDGPINTSNIYYQMLRGAKLASTPYIAVAEDDVLYSKDHFNCFRPRLDEFAYNMTRWGIFTWGEPTYSWKDRITNSAFIGPRELTIKALEERFAKYPDGTPEGRTGELGRRMIEDRLGLSHYKCVKFNSTVPIVDFNHCYSLDPLERNQRKKMGPLKAFDIPYWGRADELVQKFL